MKLFVKLVACFFFLLENGSGVEISHDKIRDSQELLIEISEKLDHWYKFFAKFDQQSTPLANDSNNDLQENLQICRTNEEQIRSLLEKVKDDHIPLEILSDLQNKLNGFSARFEGVFKNAETNPAIGGQMKNLERKLSRLQFSLDRSLLRNSALSTRTRNGEDDVKPSLPYGSEEMLMDILAKVEALYDKSTSETSFDNPKEIRHLGKSCKMLSVPYKRLLTSVDSLQRIVKELGGNDEAALTKGGELRNSVIQDIRDSLENILEEIQILRRKNEKNINENERILRRIDKKLDSELEDDDEDDEKLKKSLKKYMVEQRRILEKTLRKILKDKDDDDNDDSDDDSEDEKRKNKSKKRKNSKDDDDYDDGDDDDDDDDDSDDSKNKKKRKNKDDSDDDDDDDDDDSDDSKNKKKRKNKDDSDDDDDDDDDDIKCDDSDENGSKSCEKESRKAYSKGKKNSKYDAADSDSADDSNILVKGKRKEKKYKIKKDVREIEAVASYDATDKLAADEPVQNSNSWSFLGMHPPELPTKPGQGPDVTP